MNLQILSIPIIQRAVICLLVASASFSLLGIVIVVLNLSGIRFTLMHAGLLGAALGLAAGMEPVIPSIITIMAVSFLMGPVADRSRLDINSISGLFMTGSLGLAFILFHKAGLPAMDAFSIFTGNILALNPVDLWITLGLSALVITAAIIWYWEINMILYDREQAKVMGLKADRFYYVILLFLGLVTAVSIRLVGALLVDSIILLPAMAALPLAKSLKQAMLLTSLFGLSAGILGFGAAILFDLPISSSVILGAVLLLITSQIIGRLKKAPTV
jgi:zinc transport system permease protein